MERGMKNSKPVWDIQVEVRFQIQAADDLKAQNLVLTLLENHLADMGECPQVVEASITMGPDNPKTIGRIK
jgi:hypothetical protein